MLTADSVTKIFNAGTVNESAALSSLSLTLEDGDFATVIGGNGAGKSTLLGAIAGDFPLDGGRILIDGKDITLLPEHRRAAFLGRVFQDPMMGTAADMWLEENLALAALRGERRSLKWAIGGRDRENFRRLLEPLGLGLEDRLTTKVGLLSGGQRQAVTLLMAVMKHPKLLLLDEHTAALDPKTSRRVLELTDRFVRRERLTALMVTHNMRDALSYGNRIIMMDGGRIIFDVRGEEKRRLTADGLIRAFSRSADREFPDGRAPLP